MRELSRPVALHHGEACQVIRQLTTGQSKALSLGQPSQATVCSAACFVLAGSAGAAPKACVPAAAAVGGCKRPCAAAAA